MSVNVFLCATQVQEFPYAVPKTAFPKKMCLPAALQGVLHAAYGVTAVAGFTCSVVDANPDCNNKPAIWSGTLPLSVDRNKNTYYVCFARPVATLVREYFQANTSLQLSICYTAAAKSFTVKVFGLPGPSAEVE
jgi:hypothetical protein